VGPQWEKPFYMYLYWKKILFSRTNNSISIKLGTYHPVDFQSLVEFFMNPDPVSHFMLSCLQITERQKQMQQKVPFRNMKPPMSFKIIMFPTRSGGTYWFCSVSSSFCPLSANALRNYWRDQYETFQDDSLAFVDVQNEGNFVRKCMHARARAFEFFHIKSCNVTFFLYLFKFIQIYMVDRY
jgi:hypothetical protein